MLQLSGTTLAYIGDSIYEVKVREFLIEKGLTKVNDLHKNAIKYTSAKNSFSIGSKYLHLFATSFSWFVCVDLRLLFE